jgi:diguanylate cyclase (GGDEF)-like protein/PAS domain S-box-containing protein
MDLDDTFYKNVLDSLYDGVYFVDPQRRITYWNKGAEAISGFTAEEVVGRHCWDNILRHVDNNDNQLCFGLCPLAATIKDGDQREVEVYLHHKDGRRLPVIVRTAPVRDAEGNIIGAVEVFNDNSARLATAQRLKELEQLALLDPLTQLANRRYLEMSLSLRFDEMNRYGWSFGVLFIDADNFKRINDIYGHDIGDEVLRMIGNTFMNNARSSDSVGRWGGEEFVAIIRNVDEENLYVLAERFRLLIAESRLPVWPMTIRVTVSIGATLAQPDDSVETLLKRADRLLYQSKHAGRNRVSLHLKE